MDCATILKTLKAHSNPKNVGGMARFGINPLNTLGVPIPILRKMARKVGKDHRLASELWSSGIHEARILASMVDDPKLVTEKQMDRWAKDFDSWDVCDQVCSNLFRDTPFGWPKALEWSGKAQEFVKRAGFVLMAVLPVREKKAGDERFERFLPIIEREANDERNFVRKAVNWALRQIGKRNKHLNKKAVATAKRIARLDSKSARWIARDALRELEGDAVQRRLRA